MHSRVRWNGVGQVCPKRSILCLIFHELYFRSEWKLRKREFLREPRTVELVRAQECRPHAFESPMLVHRFILLRVFASWWLFLLAALTTKTARYQAGCR